KVKSILKPKLGLNERIAKAVLNLRPLPKLPEEVINVKKMENASEVYPNFLSNEPSTTLIRFPMITGKTKGLRKNIETLSRSGTQLPAIIWISYRKTLSNESQGKINELKLLGLKICNYQDEQNLSVDKWDVIIVQVESLSHIEFSSCLIIAVLDEVNAIQHQMNSGSNARESENAMCDVLRSAQHVLAIDAFANESTLTFLKAYRAYTNTVEVGISFEKPNHFDIVIGITNIATSVNVEAFIQMMFRICYENIHAELAVTRPNDLPTAIKGHREWDIYSISYKLDQSPAVTSFIEVEHQKRLSARNFIEISCSLIVSTGASLKLIKMDESRGVIEIRKKIRNEIRAEVSVIKHTDFEAIATSRNLTSEKAEILKLDSEHFVEHFSSPEPRKHFLRLSHFCKQGYNGDNTIEELKAKDLAQWENTCYNAKDNFENSVAKDLRKTYSVNHWEAVRGLLQSLSFTGMDDKQIRSQALLLFGFRSRTKEMPDLKSAVKAINVIVGNWCGYTIKKEVMIRKLDNSEYCPIVPVLPSYKPKVSDEIQDFFDFITITNNTTLEYAECEISDSSSNAIDEKTLSLPEAVTQQLKMPAQDVCYVNTINEAGTAEKKISESLISLSSEYLIKNESDIDILIHLLQQKFQMSQEKLDQWRFKIALEMWDNQNYWKKECEIMNKINFLDYKQKFEAKMKVPITLHKKELKNKSLAFIKYA
ncbi:8798_t:CDS:2, partial [Diversispora eburnea]